MEGAREYVESARQAARDRGVTDGDLPFLSAPDGEVRTLSVLVHGSTATPRQFTWVARRLARSGHAVVAPLLPGHGAGRERLLSTTPREGLAEVKRALRACSTSGRIPFVGGYSFGGVLALHAAAECPVAGAMSLAGGCRPRIPLHGWPAMLVPRLAGRLRGTAGTARAVTWKLRVARFSRALRRRSSRLQVPLLVWHSLADRTMLPRGSILVFRAATSSFKELVLTGGPGHPLSPCPEFDEVLSAIVRFLDRDYSLRDIAVTAPFARARQVAVIGSFNSWCSVPLARTAAGTWEKTLQLPPGEYEYAFLVDGVWRRDPGASRGEPRPNGDVPSILVVA
jgi:esterase/lipase